MQGVGFTEQLFTGSVRVEITSHQANRRECEWFATISVVWRVLALWLKTDGTKECSSSEQFHGSSDREVEYLPRFIYESLECGK